jgi:hypothetical protein
MWLSKPVYEALPYYYGVLGLVALAARLYVDYWYWPLICTIVGVGSLAAGVFVFMKRRNHRSRSR